MTGAALDGSQVRRLRWRARRGLLENDVILARFFERHADSIDADHADALAVLLELADKDLLDLLLARSEPSGALDTAPLRSLLALMRSL
jgi:antitoxin CptB